MSTQVGHSVICRVCTKRAAPETSWNLFDLKAVSDGYSLAQLVALVGDIEVHSDEESLPMWCCAKCQIDVGIAYRVRKLCQESDRKLREKLARSGAICKMYLEERSEGYSECEEEQIIFNNSEDTDISQLEETCTYSNQDNQPYPVFLAQVDQVNTKKPEEKKKFKCSYCPKLLATQEAVEFHEYGHTNPFNWKCTRCSEVFTNYNMYRTHFSTHRPPKGAFVNCEACGSRFKSRKSLLKHRTKKCTSQKYRCNSCPCSYASPEELSRHVRKGHQGTQELAEEPPEVVTDEPVEVNGDDELVEVYKIEVDEQVIRSPEAENEDEYEVEMLEEEDNDNES